MRPNLTSWGGGAIYDGKQYHLYVSVMANDCPLSTWQVNSRIEHAVAEDITGPYTFKDVAVPTWSHNPAPVVLPDGTYALFHIGNGSSGVDGGQNCSSGLPPKAAAPVAGRSAGYIQVSRSLDGPWSPLVNNTLGFCNNPAPWVHSNGTIYIVCYRVLYRADSIHGPWTKLSELYPSVHVGEDPDLYMDKRGFHIISHYYTEVARDECVDAVLSGHRFSEDGYTWHESPGQPYTSQIEMQDGRTITVSTRERPKLFFDETGQMTHLYTGVCSAEKCPSEQSCVDCKYTHWDYTLVQPFDLSTPMVLPQTKPVWTV